MENKSFNTTIKVHTSAEEAVKKINGGQRK